jgi:methylmalonyl-CoA mutase cobalamin-binding subunit
MKVVVASTDVHEFAKFLLTSTFEALDAHVIDCGINRDPEDIVKVVAETAPEAVVLTTHNGVARSFATKLMDELRAQRLSPSVFMGGVLNEDVDGADVPVDVRDDLRRLGVEIPPSVDDLVVALGALRTPAAH